MSATLTPNLGLHIRGPVASENAANGAAASAWDFDVNMLIIDAHSSGGGAVASVFGRTGVVVAGAEDYSDVSDLELGDGVSAITFLTDDSGGVDISSAVGISFEANQGAIDGTAVAGNVSFSAQNNAGTTGCGFAFNQGGYWSINSTNFASTIGVSSLDQLQLSGGTNGIKLTDPVGTVCGVVSGGPQGAGTINAVGLYVGGSAVALQTALAAEISRAQTAEATLVPKTTTVNGHALSANVTVSASDLTTGTLPHGQLPALVSGDIPNNAANTSGSSASCTGNAATATSATSATTAANLSGMPALPNGTTATTQAAGDTSTKLATDAFVANIFAAPPALGSTTAAAVKGTTINATTGFQINAAAASGHYLRGNGTNYVDGTIQAADVPTLNQNTNGSAANVPWSGLTAAAAALTLANGANGTTFNQTSAVTWLWANTTAATNLGVNGASPVQTLAGTYFSASGSAADSWSMQNTIAAGHSSTTVTNISETAGSVVTLTITGGNFVVGDLVAFGGLTTGTWLNGQTAQISSFVGTSPTQTSITFVDPTSHGMQASHAETGQVTQDNPLSTLVIGHSGSAAFQLQIPQFSPVNGSAVGVQPNITSSGSAAIGINIGRNATAIALDIVGPVGGNLSTVVGLYPAGQTTAALGLGYFNTTGEMRIWANNATYGVMSIKSNANAATLAIPTIILGNQGLAGTSGTQQVGVSLGSNELGSGNAYPQLNFTPAFGSVNFIPLRVMATVNQALVSTTISNCNITSATSATLTVASGTGFVNSASITIAGCTGTNNAQLNGTWTIASGGGTTTIVITGSGWATGNHAEATGTLKQQASGNYNGLLLQMIETAVNGANNKFLSLQSGTAGTTEKFAISSGGLLVTYGGNATVKQGSAPILASSIKTAQSAALSGSALVSSTPAVGLWRISFVATITTAATAAAVLGGTTGFTTTYTNGNGDTVSKTTALATALGVGATNNTSDSASGDLYCYAGAASAITFSYGYTAGTGTPMQYDIAVYAEYLG